MTVGNGGFDALRKVDPVGAEQHYEEHQGRKRRKVNYNGRSWVESEEDLPLQPKPLAQKQKKAPHVYADEVLLRKAEALFSTYTTLEDKIAGLFFLETEAYYDVIHQKKMEAEIQKWKWGGLLFMKGDYKRQLYLVENYKSLAPSPLLFGNDFFHSLAFYFRDDAHEGWGIDKMELKYFSDLGKAVVFQNRRLGVQFQLAENRGGVEAFFTKFPLTEDQIKAFRKGIRDASGIIGLFGHESRKFTSQFTSLGLEMGLHDFPIAGGEIKEIFSLKTLTFFDMTQVDATLNEERIISAFKNNSYDAFLFSQGDIIAFLANLIRDGKVEEKEIDKKLMKILILKCSFS